MRKSRIKSLASKALATRYPYLQVVRGRLIIVYVIATQIITAIAIILATNPLKIAGLEVAGLEIFYEIFNPDWLGAVLMLLAAFLAGIGLYKAGRYRFLFFMPQYFFLLLTTGSAVNCILQGSYTGNIVKSWLSVLIEQLPSLVLTALYLFAITDFKRKECYDI